MGPFRVNRIGTTCCCYIKMSWGNRSVKISSRYGDFHDEPKGVTLAGLVADLRPRRVPVRGRRDAQSPVLEEVRESLLEGDLGLPPERLVNFRRVPFQHHHIGRPQSLWIDLDGDPLRARAVEVELEHL